MLILCVGSSLWILANCMNPAKKDFFIDFNVSEKLKLSLIADSVRFMQLEENDSCLISGTNMKLCIDNHQLYILDGKTSSVFRYTLEGKLLNKICHKGNGPGEYPNVENFYVKDNIVYIKYFLSIYQYTPEGRFIKKDVIPHKQFITDFIPTSSDYMILYKPEGDFNKNGIYLISPQSEDYKVIVRPVKEYNFQILVAYNFCDLGNGTYVYADYYNGHIYHFTEKSSRLAYTFSLSKKMDEDILQQNAADILMNNKSAYTTYLSLCIESKNFLLLRSRVESDKCYFTVYNKKTKETKTGASLIGQNSFEDDLGNATWYGSPYYYDNKLYIPCEEVEDENRKIEIVYLK